MSTTLGWPTWGSGPTITLWYGYDYRRSGADMEYRIYGEVNTSGATLYFGYSIDADVYLDGSWKYSKHLKDNSPTTWSNTLTFDSGWKTVANKVDGSTSCSIKLSTNAPRGSSTWSYSLPVSPAGSDISTPNGTLGVSQTITITKRNASFTDTVTYSCGTQSGTIVTDTLAGSVTWTPPVALASEVTDSTSVPITLTTTTKNAGTTIQSKSITITCAIPASIKPSCTVAISDPTGYATTYGDYVQSKSTLQSVITATTSYGSPINTYSTVADGNTYTTQTTTTPVLQNTGAQTVTATVTDKRGRVSDAATASYNVIAYAQPTLSSYTIQRGDADGTPNAEGHYMVIDFTGVITALNNVNSAVWAVRYRVAGSGTWTDVAIPSLTGNYTPTHQEIIAAADANAFEVEVRATDDFGTITVGSGSIPIAFTIMNWRTEGDGMAVGGINTKTGFQMYMDSEFTGDADFQGDVNVVDIDASGDIKKNGSSIFPVSVANGGTGADNASDALINLGLDVQTVTPTLTKTSGGSCTVAMRQYGKIVFVSVSATTSGTVSAGGNIYVGTLSNFPAPIFNTIGIAYYDGRAVAVQIQTNGTITVRNLISSAGSGQTSQTSWCYMTA